MVDQLNQKLEVVAMQDKIKLIDSMKVIINKPFDELSIRFLEDLSGEIKKMDSFRSKAITSFWGRCFICWALWY